MVKVHILTLSQGTAWVEVVGAARPFIAEISQCLLRALVGTDVLREGQEIELQARSLELM